ncbi:MAG: alpha-amylase family glycosyl hydrolase [Balneolaceae bacterium]
MKSNLHTPVPGATFTDTSTHFCLYCPKAASMECVIFSHYEDENGVHYTMEKDENGYWHLTIDERLTGKWYGYKAELNSSLSPYKSRIFADPYSRHVTAKNNYRQEAKSYLFEDIFDWGDDTHLFPEDHRDLVIYETHIKDLTAHPSAKSRGTGSYQKFIDPDQKGGINYLRKLGVNCIEFLPLHKFSPPEPPYGEETPEGFHNTWNIYSENYWGYMTSFFFAPESSFASDFSNRFSGKTTAAVSEFKNVVKTLHREGISVIMDVVFNHTSLFDMNPLTHLAPEEYLRHNKKGELLNRSGTGNEYRSETPVARKLITDSILYWMDEYHIDGFRFDLAALLDQETWKVIREEVQKKYPEALLIAEPWGGYYSPSDFSDHGWAAWNDRIRNSIKGADPIHDRGFIFSDWQHETRRERLENIFKGTLNNGEGGLFHSSDHSVNYLESHDGYTLGDFIRIGLNPDLHEQKISDREKHVRLDEPEMRLSKLAALSLFTTQGITMIHAGQEFARSKIIAKTPFNDPDEGRMDHNSYQKNNETNWLNFDDLNFNSELFDYYRGLIEIRRQSPALRKCEPDDINFDYFGDPLVLSFYISGQSAADLYDYYVILNGNADDPAEISLPGGLWELLADKNIASSQTIDILSGRIQIDAQCGILLRKLRH